MPMALVSTPNAPIIPLSMFNSLYMFIAITKSKTFFTKSRWIFLLDIIGGWLSFLSRSAWSSSMSLFEYRANKIWNCLRFLIRPPTKARHHIPPAYLLMFLTNRFFVSRSLTPLPPSKPIIFINWIESRLKKKKNPNCFNASEYLNTGSDNSFEMHNENALRWFNGFRHLNGFLSRVSVLWSAGNSCERPPENKALNLQNRSSRTRYCNNLSTFSLASTLPENLNRCLYTGCCTSSSNDIFCGTTAGYFYCGSACVCVLRCLSESCLAGAVGMESLLFGE